MHLDKDCYGTIALAWILGLAAIYLINRSITIQYVSKPLIVIVFVFICFVTWFHRVPHRQPLGDERSVLSVADGKVVIVEKVYEKEYLKKECIQVSVYMNFFDVHANFWPMSGEITYYKYHPGKHLMAFYPKASEKNEHSSIAMKNEFGEVFFRQIAGTFARRIVCYAKEGEQEERGKQCGIIKFGSRIDMFLPLDADIKVKVGDLTRTCETVIAEL
ncbi:MAG: phosphatidylserine decarboxylase family protein [Bacteroidales bacterium]|nr:phosphatidylserine decarboxylase family protein [Bacteroidales bacterium]